MKRNVDLTEDQLFRNHFFEHHSFHGSSYQEMFCFDECFPDVFVEKSASGSIYKQPNPCNAICDEIKHFAKSDSLIAMGNSLLREIKFLVKKRYNNEVCEECDGPVRIPWSGGLCSKCRAEYKAYKKQKRAPTIIPWSHYYSYISGIRSIPWLRRF